MFTFPTTTGALSLLFLLQILSPLSILAVRAQQQPECALPSWTIKDIKIKSRDAVGNSGSASFTLVLNATGKAEPLACARLQGNYRCAVKSKNDPGVEVDLQINTGVVHMSVTQLSFACGSPTKSIAGNTDIDLDCTEPTRAGGDISCVSDAGGTIQAVFI